MVPLHGKQWYTNIEDVMIVPQAYVEISRARMREKHDEIVKKREFAKKSKAAAVSRISHKVTAFTK